MTPKTIDVLKMCIDNGTNVGVYRAFKHNDNPPHELLTEKVEQAIWEQLHEWFDFEPPTDATP